MPGDSIIIVQHAKGKKKQIALNDGVIDYGLYKKFLRYKTDSDYGSSGSPVFNNKWQLVALHHAAIFQPTDDTTKQQTVIAQQGIRICRIIEDLKKKSVSNPKLASFIEDFVVTSEQLNYPPLPSALKFDGESSDVDLGDLNLSIAEGITFEAWLNRNSMSSDGTIVSQGLDFSVSWRVGKIWINVGKNEFYTIDAVLNHNCWFHVAVTFSNDNSIVIYIDGKQQKHSSPLNVDNKNNDNSKNNLYLGCGNFGYFTGFMAEVWIWGVACSQDQIQKNMYRRLSKDDQTNLRDYYRFKEEQSYKVYNYFKVNKSTKNEEDNSNNLKEDELLCGLQLNGKNDFIDCGKDENFKIEDAITIEAWVKKSDHNDKGVIVNQGGSWDKHGYCLWINDNKIRVELQNNKHIFVDTEKVFDKPGENTITSNFKLDKWYHIACTWSRNSTENIEIYVNGIKEETNIPQDSAKKLSDEPIEEFKVNLNIGRAEGYGFHFNGAIAEVRLWKIARTEREIKDYMHVQLTGDEQGLVGYWRLDEEEGNTAKNKVNDDGIGIVCGGKWLKPYCLLANNQGAFGVAYRTNRLKASQYPGLPLPFGLKFNGKDDQVDCGNENLAVSKAITVEAWFKHKFGNCVIVSQVEVDADQNGYSLSWNSGRIRVALQSQDSSEKKIVVVYTKENAPQDCVWHHIAFTWEQNSHEVSLYIDGRIQDCVVEGSCETIVFAGQTRSIGLFTGSLDNLTTNFLIGCKEEKETYYNVAIADVRLWKVARTQDEIKANMSRRLEGNEKDLIGYWRLDDGGEDNLEVQNLVPNSQPGKITGATWFPQPPKPIYDKDTTNQENNSVR
ncbi:LamG-like jellyroll fold domain-containing protein [Nostoc sp.]|uniref:LamG-like jellyroll fold domain-containing protein n=1 Tax=Nostoc sp. TaxID=1180 RepID=UPI002FF674A2